MTGKKKWMVILSFLAITVMAFFSASCGKKDKAAESSPPSEASSEAVESAGAGETVDTSEVPLESESVDASEVPSDPESEDVSDPVEDTEETVNPWAKAYYDHLIDFDREYGQSEYDGLEYRNYEYIYVNDDDIPELVMQGQSEAIGNIILTYHDGIIDELQTSRLYFDYLERKNQLRNSDGHMGGYYDYVYSIQNGKWVMTNCGEYYVEDNSQMWDDEDLIYEWDGEKVSSSEYNKALEEVYDISSAKTGVATLGYLDILNRLERDAAGDESDHIDEDTRIHKYQVIVKDVTWKEALEDCRERGGYLLRLNSYEEKYFVENMLKDNDQEKLVIWLGGCLNPEDGHFHWFDGERYSAESLDNNNLYQYNWLSGEPSFTGVDANGEMTDENCLCMFMVKGLWRWNDVPEDISAFYKGKIAYICESE